jgi:tetratricopeptide (TPR) repeat protein
LRAGVELGLASIHYRQTRYAECIEHAQLAIRFGECAGDLRSQARACYIAAAAYTDMGSSQSISYLERALPIYEELSDFRGVGAVLNNLGIQHYHEGRWKEALESYRASRDAKLRAGDDLGAVIESNNEAEILSDQGKLDEAEPLFEEMVRLSRAAGFRIGLAVGLSNIARLASRGRRYDEAHAWFDEAVALFEQIDARRYVTEVRTRIAECMVYAGRYGEALDIAAAQLEAAHASPAAGLEALVERTYGYALWQARRPDEARPHFDRSLQIARELNAPFELALTLSAMADVRFPDADALRTESDKILAGLGVISVPTVPLP